MSDKTTPFTLDKRNSNTPIIVDIDTYPQGIVLSINKPYGWTSADVVRKMKFQLQRFFKKKNIKVGHSGTLDPLATGVLLICIGKATKWAERLQAENKTYIAEIKFGSTTPSFDLEKEVDYTFPFEHITKELILETLPQFIGKQEQVPPIFSAKLVNGNRAYELARAGVSTELKPSEIEIFSADLLDYENGSALIKISCSKGTYIRSFARDLGLALNSGAHLTNLQRSSSGDKFSSNSLNIEDALKLFS